jgi:hypothetical protein
LLGNGTNVIALGGYFVGEKKGVGLPLTPANGCHVNPFGGFGSDIKQPAGGSRRAGALRTLADEDVLDTSAAENRVSRDTKA